ncbi:MAG TPA: hypothetical protein VEA79_14615, partial [Phenylobacterium sp.]|nr:hypothetical protein [Phenylobacterium sp.]
MFRTTLICGIFAAVLGGAEAAAATLKADACPAGYPAEARCSLLKVPEDRSKPEGRRLDLKLVVLPARAAQPQAPVFILSGGPGQPATDSVPGFAGSWMRQAHDMVFLDLRGTGRADGLDCPPRPGAGLQVYLEPPFADTARFEACRAELARRADLRLYT